MTQSQTQAMQATMAAQAQVAKSALDSAVAAISAQQQFIIN